MDGERLKDRATEHKVFGAVVNTIHRVTPFGVARARRGGGLLPPCGVRRKAGMENNYPNGGIKNKGVVSLYPSCVTITQLSRHGRAGVRKCGESGGITRGRFRRIPGREPGARLW